MKQHKAAFFDRDGTLIKDVAYLSDLAAIELLPHVVDFCCALQKKGYLLFVVTNQSGVARGFFDELFVQKTHVYLADLFAKQGVFFTHFYYCPHHPDIGKKQGYQKKCLCRKPSPGMLHKAAKEYDLDLSRSIMFGDKIIDIEAGVAAGCKSFYIQTVINRVFTFLQRLE